MRQFQPLNDRVLVKRLPWTPLSSIAIPEVAQEKSKLAEVVALGKLVHGLKIGDIVLLPGVAAKYPDWEQADFMLIQEADVGGIYHFDEA